MLNTKSSTSSEIDAELSRLRGYERSFHRLNDKLVKANATIAEFERSGDKYKLLLEELLAEIHRDGGQFTKLAGLMTSLQEAHKIVIEQRCRITRLLTATRNGR